MSRNILLLTGLLISGLATAFSQKTISLHAVIGSGVSSFRGSGTVTNTVLYRNGLPFPNSIDTVRNHFGRQAYTNFTVGAQANLKVLPSLIISVDALYERSGGRLTIDSVYSPSENSKINGVHKRKYDYLSLNPQIARRISLGPVGIRFSAGIDYCIKLNLGINSTYTDLNGKKNSVGGTGNEPEVNDIRLTGSMMLNFNKWALAATYKYGLIDYSAYKPGNVYARLLHIRLLYRLLGI